MPKTILLVDDDALFRAVIGDGLRAAGYTVVEAADGLEALQKIREAPPDCILLDLIMPKLDGVRTCRLLKQHPEQRAIPIILLTGVGREGLKALGELGAEAAVAKRQAGATLTEVLQTLRLLESSRRKASPPAEAAPEPTERRIVSELLDERQHTQTLLASLGEGVVELDDEGRVVYLNPSALALLKRPEDAILGRPGVDLFGAAHGPALERVLREIRGGAEGHPARVELACAQKTLEVTLSPLPAPGGPPGALLVLRDVTQDACRARSLRALAAVGHHILGNLALPAVLREIVACTADLLGVERCGLFRIEQAGDQIRLRCIQAIGLSERYARDLYLAPGEAAVGKALAERRTVYTSELLQDPGIHLSPALRSLVQEEGIGAVLAAPILSADGAFGTLTVYHPAGHRFTPEEVELATSLAGSVAIAIQNAQLFEQEQARRRQLEAVRAVTGEILRELDLSTLLGLITRRAVELVGAASGTVYLWDEAAQVLVPQAWHGLGDWVREVRVRLGEGITGTVAQRREGMVVNDYRTWPAAIPLFLERTARTAALAEPLLYRDRLLGVISINNEGAARPFTAEDRELLGLFAAQAAIAIENARLIHSATQAAHEIEALYEGAQAIAESLDLETTLARIAESARRLAGSDRAFVWLVDSQEGWLRAGVAVGEGAEAFLGTRAAADGPATAARAVREGRPIAVSDAHDPAQADPGISARFGNAALLAVPLRVGDAIPGVLVCGYGEPRVFLPTEIERLARLAQQAAVAIQNARLYAQTREALDELSVLHEAGQAIAQSLDLQDTLQRILPAATRLTKTTKGILWLLDEERQELVGTCVTGLLGDPTIRLSLSEPSFAAACLREGRVLTSESPGEDPRCHPGLQARYGNKAMIAVPLRSGPRAIGVLDLGDLHRTRRFGPQEIAILERLAQQAVVAIENARLYGDVQRRAGEATALAEVGRILGGSLDMDRVLDLVVREVQRVMGVPFAGIMSLDAERQELTYVKCSGLSVGELAHVRLRVGEGIAGRAVEQGAPVQSSRLLEDPRYVSPGLAETQGFRSLLCAPLVAGSRPLGVLAVSHREEREFSPAEVQLLTLFAAQSAIAIENARLYAETRKAYEDLQGAQEQLVHIEKFRALGEMAGGVAHDFNNLLATILGRAQILQVKAADPELRRGLEVIEQAALDGAHTVRRILGFARVRPDAHYAPVDVGALLKQVLEVTRPRWQDEAQGRGAAIEAVLAVEPVPAVWGHAGELQEALVNLVFNAVDAMPQGGRLTIGARRPEASARGAGPSTMTRENPAGAAEEPHELVEVFVQDTGVGMPAEVRARAFEPFFTTKGTEGSGLGLAMVYGIASRHGGEVQLDSGEGTGVRVTLRLPATTRSAGRPPEPAAVPPARINRIAVVDDNGRVGDVLADLLRSQGHEVTTFTDPHAALAHLTQEPVDVLFTDLGMPEMSGWDVSQKARDVRPDIPVVLVTGWGDQIDPEQVSSHRVSGLVKKPFRAEDVLRLLAELMPPSGRG